MHRCKCKLGHKHRGYVRKRQLIMVSKTFLFYINQQCRDKVCLLYQISSNTLNLIMTLHVFIKYMHRKIMEEEVVTNNHKVLSD